jgi:hypothetical protein
MSFFSMFPYRSFDLQDNGVPRIITDIFRNVDVNDALLNRIAAYRSYYIGDGERPDIVSSNIYGTPDYYWTFFITNDFLKEGLNNWPMNNLELEKFVVAEYGNHSVLTFVPLAIPNKKYRPEGEGAQEITYTQSFNTFSNLPLGSQYLPYLHLVAYGTGGSRIAASKIIRFDSSTLQLWIERNSNNAYYNPTGSFKYTLEFINTYVTNIACANIKKGASYKILEVGNVDYTQFGSIDNEVGTVFTATKIFPVSSTGVVEDAEYEAVEALKLEWNEKILAGLESSDLEAYFLYKDSNPQIYPVLKFIPSDIWQDSYNAAYNFYKEESDGSSRTVTYYDLMLDQIATLNGQYSMTSMKNTNTNYVSYIQNEYNINESHRNITVVEPTYISAFEESFKTALNSNV